MAGFQAALPAGPVIQGLNSCAAQTDSNNTKVTPPGLQAVAAAPVYHFWSFPMSALFSPTALVVPFENLRMTDVEAVGGKNASLGEMISQLPSGVRVPTGFATTAHAFREFLKHDGLTDRINARLDALDTEDVRALGRSRRRDPRLGRGAAVSGRPGDGDP
jgi:hypothetical protein